MPDRASSGSMERLLPRRWAALIPGVVTLCVTLYRLSGPSFTRDEAATMLAVHRSFGQLVQMLGNVDVVHGAYYSLIWVVTRLAGSGPFAARLPSAVAAAVAASVIALIAARLVSGLAGLAAGLVYAALPPVSFYAEDAREYAIMAALATIASYLLIRLLDERRTRPRSLVLYALTVATLGLTNIFGLLIIPAHAMTLAIRLRQDSARSRRGVAARWLAASAAGALVAAPVVIAGYGQIAQVGWIKRPGLAAVAGLTGLAGGNELLLVMLVIAVVAIAATVALPRLAGHAAQARLPQPVRPGTLLALAGPWLLLPPGLMLAASLAHPVYVFRYVVLCMPAVALLAGTALAALGPAVGAAALAVIVVIAVPAQVSQRAIHGHGYGILSADRIVARHLQPGDALFNVRFAPLSRSAGMERQLEAAYPFGLSQLRDVTEGQTPAQSATLGGTFASASVVSARLAGVQRLWVASWSPQPPTGLAGFTRVQWWHPRNVWLWLYQRGGQ